jgi:hypothetical protein
VKPKATFKKNVLKAFGDMNLPNKSRVSITIQESFSDLLDVLDEPEARDRHRFRPERDAKKKMHR